MLEELRIAGLGVIDSATIEFGPGLTVITGETGAGKTMLLAALGLITGAKADPGRIRPGASRATVDARFGVDGPLGDGPSSDGPVAGRVREAGGELDDGSLIVGRSVGAGRSRAFAGGVSVPAGVLAELGEALLTVHGQSDQMRLLRPSHQRDLLDRSGGAALLAAREKYETGYRTLRANESELAELRAGAAERARQADLLAFGLDEISRAEPVAGEEVGLAAEVEKLANADALRLAASGAHDLIAGAEDDPEAESHALASLYAARRDLDAVGGHDPALDRLAARISESAYVLADLAGELAEYRESVEADPLRLAAALERQALLADLMRKYGSSTEQVLSWAKESAARLAGLTGADDRIDQLAQLVETQRDELAAAAGRLSKLRGKAARALEKKVAAELAGLAMPKARFEVRLGRGHDEPLLQVDGEECTFGAHGIDTVEFVLAAHPGAPLTPLGQGASGGELSRVMLAIEVALAEADPTPTLVFDEVDAGVGGKAAVEVGRRLARLAADHQVILVTHLPQVAAFADHHVTVTKSDSGAVTASDVVTLGPEDRIGELTRMLAGLADSQTGRAHALELLELAQQVG